MYFEVVSKDADKRQEFYIEYNEDPRVMVEELNINADKVFGKGNWDLVQWAYLGC